MGIDSRPFGGVTLTGEDARQFRIQFLEEDDSKMHELYDVNPKGWYDKAREEFLQDLWSFNSVDPEAAKKIYNYLEDIGMIDYDNEKEYLYDNYVI